ncbi:putative type IV secretion system, VirB3 / TrbD / AvhB [Haemophilus haemolyticus M21639]|nr:putative type IV secretion system, VirB3 / TrbD / AvhB [Haemophilus haemolyticus M21639]
MSDLNESYPSFNGMNRPAMVFGVPMVAALFVLFLWLHQAF